VITVEDAQDEVDSPPRKHRGRWLAVSVCTVAVGATIAIAAYRNGSHGDTATWHTGGFGNSMPNQLTIGTGSGDTAYFPFLPTDVAWIDAAGSLNMGGRPACLAYVGLTHFSHLRFATVRVRESGRGWDQVVLVDCRQKPVGP
jgi:hypothetical protein